MRYRHEMPFGAELRPTAAPGSACGRRPAAASSSPCTARRRSRCARSRTAGSRRPPPRRRARPTASSSTAGSAFPTRRRACNPDDVHGAEPRRRSARLRLARRRLARPAVARGRDLRAARRHLHAARARSRAAIDRLDYLADLGVTAIELMPVADFPGARNWGYDGVLPFAPDAQLRHARRPEAPGRRGACAQA